MIRMIDATELKTAFPSGEYVRTECVLATIDHMPIIDAIPMDWMESQYYKHMEIKDKYMSAYAVVLAEWNEWKREQEARTCG